MKIRMGSREINSRIRKMRIIIKLKEIIILIS